MGIPCSIFSFALVMLPVGAMAAGMPCEQLATAKLPNAKIDLAKTVPAGDLTIPSRAPQGRPTALKSLPAFCRIAATLTPSPNSDIKIEVWLPSANWNGKIEAIGNGGWAGSISYTGMADALKAGYATTSTDTGHVGAQGEFALNHPEKLIDFGWRSEHEMTLKAKAIVAAFYGTGAQHAYWDGCSTGGRQALMEATRFPDDFDGLISGDAANPRARRNSWQISVTAAVANHPEGVVTVDKLRVIHAAVMTACDTLDGVKDGILENPKVCKFDIAALACKGAETPNCLTPPQVAAAKSMVTPGKFSNGREYMTALELGSELMPYGGRPLGWAAWIGPNAVPDEQENFKYTVYKNPNWDWHTINVDQSVSLAQETDHGMVDVTSTDFSKFKGKMIMYHGWGDPSVSPQGTIDYYENVLKSTPKASQQVELFMVPGMSHCRGGEGATDNFDMTAELDKWVTSGKAPASIIATHQENGKVTRSRPICPYPQAASYKGTGSTDDAANFTCKAP